MEVTTDEDIWDGVEIPDEEVFSNRQVEGRVVRDMSTKTLQPAPLQQQHVLLSPSYSDLLTKPIAGASQEMIQVTYKVDIPVTKEETFLDAYWKHQHKLKTYALDVSLKELEAV